MNMMVYLALLFFAIFTTSATDTTYFGLRVSKSCKTMLKDNLKLGENIHKDITHVKIADITETQGDWWNRRTLTLTNIRATDFVHKNENFTLDSCKMLPAGILQVDAHGDGFVWKVSFDWHFKFFSLSIGGKGTAEVASEIVELTQNYLDGLPDTNMYVKWNVTKQDLDDVFLPMIHDWLRTMLIEKMAPKLTLSLNMHTNPINKAIIKPYEEILVKDPKGTVKVKNGLSRAAEGDYKEKPYVVLDYTATISVPGTQYKKEVKESVTTPVADSQERDFDYQVCYNAKLFGEYLDLLLKAKYFVIDLTKELGAPSVIGYYKSILPELGNRYADSEKVKVIFHQDDTKEVQHLHYTDPLKRRFLVPIQCDFVIEKTEELFLTMNIMYDVQYDIVEENQHLTAILKSINVHSADTIPTVDFQAKFVVLDTADMFSTIIKDFKVAGPDGFFVDTVRPSAYKLTGIDQRVDDVCLIYEDTE